MIMMMMMTMMMMMLTGEKEIMEAISSDRMPWARSQPCNGGHAEGIVVMIITINNIITIIIIIIITIIINMRF